MRGSRQKHSERTATGPVPGFRDLLTTCPKCGGELGLWSPARETQCVFCQYRVFDRERTVH
jgi:DNA-directed RNA polymerase subunit RPC12/RpoP